MKKTIYFKTIIRPSIAVLMFSLIVSACVKSRNFDSPALDCAGDLVANTTYAEVKGLYQDQTIQIQQDLIIEGYVISSDEAGNFFSVLYFQDSPTNPTEGFEIEIDVRDSHLFYPIGSKIYIKLKGLYLGKSKDVYKIGGVFTSFGNASVGRLPATAVSHHIFVACDAKAEIAPTLIALPSVPKNSANTLVQLDNVEISEADLDLTFAVEGQETERTLTDCGDNEMVLLNSGFSDFQSELLPTGNGSITGVLLRENDHYRLAVRSLDDIDFNQERCEDLVDEFTSSTFFISEIADPDNDIAARFVELYNSGKEPLSMKGWALHRYTNANTEISSSIDLSGFTIGGRKYVRNFAERHRV